MTVETRLSMPSAAAVPATTSERMIRLVRIDLSYACYARPVHREVTHRNRRADGTSRQ